MSLTFKPFLVMLITALIASVVLAESYFLVSDQGFEAWVAAALINSVLGTLAAGLYIKGCLDTDVLSMKYRFTGWRAYIPAAGVLAGTLSLAALSRFYLPGDYQASTPRNWTTIAGWVLWVPLAEELVFRVGFGGFFRRTGGIVWGSYVSVALFSFMHTLPTIDHLLSGEVGFTLGTLLLGAACELVWIYTRSVGAIYSLHAVCNLTAVIFSLLDPRWLSWLGPLYL